MPRWVLDETAARWGRRSWHGLIGYAALGFFVVSGFAILLLTFNKIDEQLERAREAQSDNSTWVISQLQVDYLNLLVAAKTANATVAAAPAAVGPALADVRQAYDIMFSRVNLLQTSRVGDFLDTDPRNAARVEALQNLVEGWMPAIDGPDEALLERLPAIEAELEAEAANVRETAVRLLQAILERAEAQRVAVRDQLGSFAVSATILFLLLSFVAVYLVRLYRALNQRAGLTERIAANLRATIDAALDGVVVIDDTARVLEFNGVAERIFGYSRAEALGSDLVRALVSEEEYRTLREELKTYLREGQSRLVDGARMVITARRRNGESFTAEVALTRAAGLGGQPIFITFVRDIEEQVRYEASLREARNAALKGEQAKSRFLAVMSHEMRTPLNGLIASLELLESSLDAGEHQRRLLDVARNCSQIALEQVNNVLELTRLEATDSRPPLSSVFAPAQVLDEIVEQNRAVARSRGNRILTDFPPGMPLHVLGLRQQFQRVAYNLIGNAVKFTENGKVGVSLKVIDETDHDVGLLLEVFDTGIGIAPENLDRIFNNFETLDATYARAAAGTGLGLGIARMASDAMGGTITVESRLGLGSKFTLAVRFPRADPPQEAPATANATAPAAIQAAPEPVRPPPPAAAVTGLSILVAEDNEINRFVLRELLLARNHRITEVPDGLAAAERAHAERFDLILMDISMPVMDGIAATERILQGGASQDTPIIGVTAHASPDELRRFLANGMSDVVIKPISGAAIDGAIERVMTGRTGTPPGEGTTARSGTGTATAGNRKAAAAAARKRRRPAGARSNPRPDSDADNAAEAAARVVLALAADRPLLDADVAEEACSLLGAERWAGFVLRFSEEAAAELPRLLALCEAAAHADLASRAHRLAGSAAMIGAARLQSCLGAVERAARDGASADLPGLLAATQTVLSATTDALHHQGDALRRNADPPGPG
ncbi:ATP-binding protein [Plastorhodobacter daqingensis]|uniref:histidine kinase n=1 Tax=Plastorhodobacter daqingensis TaxID=1387281 RepID=A0ABW2UI23_9RHOB